MAKRETKKFEIELTEGEEKMLRQLQDQWQEVWEGEELSIEDFERFLRYLVLHGARNFSSL